MFTSMAYLGSALPIFYISTPTDWTHGPAEAPWTGGLFEGWSTAEPAESTNPTES